MADEPSPRELERLISRNHAETSADILDLKSQLTANVTTLIGQFDKYVLAKVYEADERARTAVNDALSERLKKVEDEQTTNRRGKNTALVMAGVAVLGAAAGAVFSTLKGG